MKLKIPTAIAAATLALSSQTVVAKERPPQMTALELQQIQSHDFEAPKDMVFSSVMSVIQDSGYRVQTADLNTGLITGIGSSQGKLTYNLFVGFGRSKKSPIVSVFIESIGPNITRVRMNFVMAKIKSNAYGAQPQDEEPILDASVYADAFEKVEQAVFLRQSMTTPAPTPAPAAPSAEMPSANQSSTTAQ